MFMKAKITSWIEGLSQRKGKNLFLTFALIMCSVFSVVAQQSVTGTVTSKEGPIAGASVTVKGTNRGTSADSKGQFTHFKCFFKQCFGDFFCRFYK
jgi:hypothetical protein